MMIEPWYKIEDFPSIEGVKESAIFTTMLSPAMLDMKNAEAKPLVELAAAILLDKPIVIMEMDGVETPESLKKVATKIIKFETPEQAAGELKDWIVAAYGEDGE